MRSGETQGEQPLYTHNDKKGNRAGGAQDLGRVLPLRFTSYLDKTVDNISLLLSLYLDSTLESDRSRWPSVTLKTGDPQAQVMSTEQSTKAQESPLRWKWAALLAW